MVNSPLIRPYFLLGGGIAGAPLDSHDSTSGSSSMKRLWPVKASDDSDGRSVSTVGICAGKLGCPGGRKLADDTYRPHLPKGISTRM